MKPLLAQLGEINIQIMMYIDDALLVHNSFEDGVKDIKKAVSLLESQAFSILKDKSSLIPSDQITYLGFILDSNNMSVTLTAQKVSMVKSLN